MSEKSVQADFEGPVTKGPVLWPSLLRQSLRRAWLVIGTMRQIDDGILSNWDREGSLPCIALQLHSSCILQSQALPGPDGPAQVKGRVRAPYPPPPLPTAILSKPEAHCFQDGPAKSKYRQEQHRQAQRP